MPRPFLASAIVAWLALAAAGCERVRTVMAELGLTTNEVTPSPFVGPEPESETPSVDAGPSPPDDLPTAGPPAPVERAAHKHPFLAKGGSTMGFRLDGLAELHALSGEVTVPAWSARSNDDPTLVRDDDLATAWTCTPEGEHRCALAISFPTTVTVAAVRLFAAQGPGTKAAEVARPRRLRIHAEGGYLDVNLPDQRDYVYAILGGAIETRALGLEVLEAGPGDGRIHVADLEIYGRGPSREPLELDPALAFVAYEGAPWVRRGEGYDAREGWVKTIATDGSIRTLSPGSALRGYVGDRLILLERLIDASCREARGTFFLLDRRTRMVAPLGELAGVGADLFRRPDGLGLALGYTDTFTTTLNGITLEQDRYVRKHTPVRDDMRSADTFAEWGMDDTVIRRGGAGLADPAIACGAATDDALLELEEALARGSRSRLKDARVPAHWQICELDRVRLFASDRGGCGDGWELHVLGDDGKVVASTVERAAHALLRVVRISAAAVLVEATADDDRAIVYRVTPQAIEVLAPAGALAVPPPSRCRTPCSAAFANPLAPAWK